MIVFFLNQFHCSSFDRPPVSIYEDADNAGSHEFTKQLLIWYILRLFTCDKHSIVSYLSIHMLYIFPQSLSCSSRHGTIKSLQTPTHLSFYSVDTNFSKVYVWVKKNPKTIPATIFIINYFRIQILMKNHCLWFF